MSPAATAAAPCASSSLSSALAPRLPPAPAPLPPHPAPLPHLPLAGSLSSCLRSRLLPAARAPLPASPPPAASPPWCLPARLGRRSSPAPGAPGLRSLRASSAPQWLGPDATGAERAGRAELREASDARPGWGPGALASSPCPLVITGLVFRARSFLGGDRRIREEPSVSCACGISADMTAWRKFKSLLLPLVLAVLCAGLLTAAKGKTD